MPKKNKAQQSEIEIEFGSGNVFADLGLPHADELHAKAELASQICALLREAALTQSQAAELLGIDQPKVSQLMRGLLRGFSIERLIRFLNMLNRDVIITLQPPKQGRLPGVRVLAVG